MSTTYDKVADIIAETCDIPRETIKPESHATKDLEIDSLDFLDIAFAIDKAFGIKLPLEQWTQEVNDGTASTDKYFVLQNLSTRIDELVAAKGRLRRQRMRLEYFQMIDRIVDIDVDARRAAFRLHRAEGEHDFRGPLSHLSADARRAVDRMHGANDRMARLHARPVCRHAVSRRRQGSQVPHAGVSRRRARIRRQRRARGLGLHNRRMRRHGATAPKSATPSSLSASCRFPARNSARHSSPGANGSIFPSGSSLSDRSARGVDHRRRSSHLPRRGARSDLGLSSRAAIRRLTTTRALRPTSCIRCRR